MGGKEVLHTWNVPVLSFSASSALGTYLQSDVCLVRSLSHQFIVLIDPLVQLLMTLLQLHRQGSTTTVHMIDSCVFPCNRLGLVHYCTVQPDEANPISMHASCVPTTRIHTHGKHIRQHTKLKLCTSFCLAAFSFSAASTHADRLTREMMGVSGSAQLETHRHYLLGTYTSSIAATSHATGEHVLL